MASNRVPKAPAPAAEGLSFLHEQLGSANQSIARPDASSRTRLDAPTKPANDEVAAGLSALFQQLAQPAGAGPASANQAATMVGVDAGADGRSLLAEQLGRGAAGDPATEAQRARLAASVMATFAGHAQGRSALFDQLARGAPASAANDESSRALKMLETLAAMPEGRAALLAEFSRMVPSANQPGKAAVGNGTVARSAMALQADGRSAVVQLVAGNPPRKAAVERVQIVPGAGIGRTALVAGLDRPQPPERKPGRVPIWAAVAAIAIVAAGGLAGWKLWSRSGGHGGTSSVLVADFDNRTGEVVFDGTVEPGFALALSNTSALKPMSRVAALQSAEQLGLPGARLPEDRARAVARHNGVQVVTSGIIQRTGDTYRVTVRAVDVATGNRVAEESATVPGKGAVIDEATRLATQLRQAITAWAADRAERHATH